MSWTRRKIRCLRRPRQVAHNPAHRRSAARACAGNQRVIGLLLGCLVQTAVAFAGAVPVWPQELSADRRALLASALEILQAHPAVPYVTGGVDASGLDCSGAIVFLLTRVGGTPPRTAHDQYLWLKKLGRLTEVPSGVRNARDPAFASLQPGDLIFWAPVPLVPPGTPTTPTQIRASHVHMYLGVEKDGHAVMIGSSDGRSYRGTRISGFGITDFRVPTAGSPTRIVAFGPPPPIVPAPTPSTQPSEKPDPHAPTSPKSPTSKPSPQTTLPCFTTLSSSS